MTAPARKADIPPSEPRDRRSAVSTHPVRAFRSRWERFLGATESPVESDFLAAFCLFTSEYGYFISSACGRNNETVVVKPQTWIDRYRVVFLIKFSFFGEEYLCVVEIDGHDWHERTKAQARRDKSRDRALQRLGYEVFRFTGSEVRAASTKCAAEVLEAIMEWQTAQVTRLAPEPWGE